MRRFAQLFAGRTDAYGLYTEGQTRSDGKNKGRGSTVKSPVTDQLFADHLSGGRRLGLIPIRKDGTVSWFAGDIDDYSIDHQKLVKDVAQFEIPVVVVQTKSKGAHLFCFVNGVISADSAIELMRKWTKQLGIKKCEIFPKQSKMEEDGIGNWIHLPYFNENKTDAFAFGNSGEQLSLAQFEQIANAKSGSPKELIELLHKTGQADGVKGPSQAPPCIDKMFKDGLSEGGRNNALTHIGIYYLKSDPDNWRDKLAEANYNVLSPPLPLDEVSAIVKNVAKAKYEYMCNVEPMCSICDKDECKTRKWGVGPQQGINYADIEIDRIIKIKTDPPIYYVIVNSETIKMTTEDLMSGPKFRKRVFEITGKLIGHVKPNQHDARLQMARIDEEEAPEEVSTDGMILESFHDWCETNIPNSPDISQVLRGNPFYDKELSNVVFRAQDLTSAFKRQKKFNISDRDVWAALRGAGCIRENIRIDTKQVKVWKFPVDVPWFELPEGEAF